MYSGPEGAAATIAVCERACQLGKHYLMVTFATPCSDTAWKEHVSNWRTLLHFLATRVRACFIPWDLNFDNLGRNSRWQWLAVDFDVFESTNINATEPATKIQSNWWKALKKVQASYLSNKDHHAPEAWSRKPPMGPD